MDTQLDAALQAMSLEDDTPLILSNEPEYCSIERNHRSILGRFLNPDNQRMSNWILDMPRMWRLYDRVRGIALSKDRFQFIFKYEEDLNEVLKTGVWTQDDWCVTMEKWVEEPPDEYLNFLPVWIRLRNLPVNYYRKKTIKEIAECVGKVIECPFDEDKPQSQDYVRVRVLFDVFRGLRNSKQVQLPNRSIVKIGIDYERVRKRCFQCQKLTHDKASCPSTPLILPDLALDDVAVPFKSTEKGKGIAMQENSPRELPPPAPKLLADAFKSDLNFLSFPAVGSQNLEALPGISSLAFSTGINSGSLEASSSCIIATGTTSCKRPRSGVRKKKDSRGMNKKQMIGPKEFNLEEDLKKQIQDKGKGVINSHGKDRKTVVLRELPQYQ